MPRFPQNPRKLRHGAALRPAPPPAPAPTVVDGQVTAAYVVRNPHKLTSLTTPAALTR